MTDHSTPEPTIAHPMSELDLTALAQAIHDAQEWQYDQCDHGTYSGGPDHGEPYAMCKILAERLADSDVLLNLTERARVAEAAVEGVKALTDARVREINELNATPDPLTGRHSTMRAFVLTDDLIAALTDTPTTEPRPPTP